jgi:hypothetical protein
MASYLQLFIRHHRRIIIAFGLAVTLGMLLWPLFGRPTERIDSYNRCAEDGNPVTETNPPICTYGGHGFIGPLIVPKQSTLPTTQVPFEILVDADSHGTYPQHQEVITTLAAWQRYWRTVHASLPKIPPILPVNFATSNVIALSEGRQSTDGYALKVTNVSTSSAGTTINVTESIPTITCVVAPVVTDRYFIIRTAKLPAPVTFDISSVRHHCK